MCARASIFKYALKVPFLQDYEYAYVFLCVHVRTYIRVFVLISGLAEEETNLHDPADGSVRFILKALIAQAA